jgi:hypothetical protein
VDGAFRRAMAKANAEGAFSSTQAILRVRLSRVDRCRCGRLQLAAGGWGKCANDPSDRILNASRSGDTPVAVFKARSAKPNAPSDRRGTENVPHHSQALRIYAREAEFSVSSAFLCVFSGNPFFFSRSISARLIRGIRVIRGFISPSVLGRPHRWRLC